MTALPLTATQRKALITLLGEQSRATLRQTLAHRASPLAVDKMHNAIRSIYRTLTAEESK